MVIEWTFISFRLLLVCRLILTGHALFMAIGFAELLSLVGCVRNLQKAESRDSGIWAFVVPLGYLAGLIVYPSSQAAELSRFGSLAVIVGLAAIFLSLALRVWFGAAYSIGRASFVRVVSTGPYRFVRHPQASLALISCACVAIAYPSIWNWIACLAYSLVVLLTALREERFLNQHLAWRDYAARVRWRLVPRLI